jgi:hypothetical protein
MRAAGSMAIVLLTLLAAALSACGDAREDGAPATVAQHAQRPPTAAQASDRVRARRALVRLRDFTAAWSLADVPVPDVRCGETDPYAGARVVASSKRILRDKVGVQETVTLFRGSRASARAFARMNAPAAARCFRRDVRRELTKEAGAQASPLEVARIEWPAHWEKATRFSATAPSSLGVIQGSIDAVHLRVGRALGALVIVSGIGPVQVPLYDRVMKLFSRRLHAALE